MGEGIISGDPKNLKPENFRKCGDSVLQLIFKGDILMHFRCKYDNDKVEHAKYIQVVTAKNCFYPSGIKLGWFTNVDIPKAWMEYLVINVPIKWVCFNLYTRVTRCKTEQGTCIFKDCEENRISAEYVICFFYLGWQVYRSFFCRNKGFDIF